MTLAQTKSSQKFYTFRIMTVIHRIKDGRMNRKMFVNQCFQSTFTCSKSTIETLEQGVKYVQS